MKMVMKRKLSKKKEGIIKELKSDDLSLSEEAKVHLRRSILILDQMNDKSRSRSQNVKQMRDYNRLNVHSDKYKMEL